MKQFQFITTISLLFTVTLAAFAGPTEENGSAINLAPGTILPVALSQGVSTQTPAGSVFAGTLSMDVLLENKIALPAGTNVQGKVMASQSARRIAGQASLVLIIDKVQVGDLYLPISVQPITLSSGGNARRTVAKTGVAAGVGAAFNGGTGAARGAAVGGAVALASNQTDGAVPAGGVVQFSLSESISF